MDKQNFDEMIKQLEEQGFEVKPKKLKANKSKDQLLDEKVVDVLKGVNQKKVIIYSEEKHNSRLGYLTSLGCEVELNKAGVGAFSKNSLRILADKANKSNETVYTLIDKMFKSCITGLGLDKNDVVSSLYVASLIHLIAEINLMLDDSVSEKLSNVNDIINDDLRKVLEIELKEDLLNQLDKLKHNNECTLGEKDLIELLKSIAPKIN